MHVALIALLSLGSAVFAPTLQGTAPSEAQQGNATSQEPPSESNPSCIRTPWGVLLCFDGPDVVGITPN